ncbi:dioxygenase family protein [Citrifermentans bremense]|uniref:dioxygenase family protein n=1 Tax=Citrifermentans bremense TaxID=60035 RepID=UPI00040BBCE9|nr:intradiol ring-cleavage dioxygenase [Citrifermentans bremense]
MRTDRITRCCLFVLLLLLAGQGGADARRCTPTPWDEIGPFYRPNAPVRNSLGKGYVLTGTVRSSADCSPIPNARIEFWHTGPAGTYDDAHRAAVITGADGRYRLETSPPPGYGQRPPHIHILVDVNGFEGLVTQHYPKRGVKSARFDLVLVPEPEQGAGVGGSRAEDLVRPGKQHH